MSDVTWFGWLYLALAAGGVLGKIWQIGRWRGPVDQTEAILTAIFTGLYVWALFTVGVKS